MRIKTVTVLGCGAIGLFYGTHLKRGGAQVRFLLRSDFETIRAQGVRVNSVAGNYHEKIDAFNHPSECAGSDLILISLKTTAKEYLLKVLPQISGPHSHVLVLQNGLGNEELVSTVFPAERIIGAVAFVCLNRDAPGVVSHTAFGMIKASGFHPGFDPNILDEISQLFAKSGIEFKVTQELKSIKWEKLVWNVPFNGLSASLGGMDTEKILKHPPTQKLVKELMKEVIVAAASQGVCLSDSLITQNIDKTYAMGPYLTSMCLDRRKGNPIETESIIGEPLKLGIKNGLSLPFMEALYAELSFYNAFIARKN